MKTLDLLTTAIRVKRKKRKKFYNKEMDCREKVDF